MKTIASLLVSFAVAFWVSAIAILAVQNAEPVSLKFLGFQSISIPFGVLLSLCASVGILATSIITPILQTTIIGRNNSADDEPDFFADDETYGN